MVKDVHGRIIAFKGRRLNGWPVPELIRMVRACVIRMCVYTCS